MTTKATLVSTGEQEFRNLAVSPRGQPTGNTSRLRYSSEYRSTSDALIYYKRGVGRTTYPMHLLTRLLILWLGVAVTLDGAEPVKTPPVGSPERKAIMDALRVPVEADLRQPVIFKVLFLRANSQWACLNATPLRPDSTRLDYRKTRYQEQIREGMFEDNVAALLKKMAGRWTVVTFHIGHTDAIWMGWDREFGAPSSIVGN